MISLLGKGYLRILAYRCGAVEVLAFLKGPTSNRDLET